MRDLKNPNLIYLKGCLFLVAACVAAVLLLAEMPTLKIAVLIGVTVWCSCRFYYFAFYVIQHYVDDDFRFAGLTDFVRYWISKKR